MNVPTLSEEDAIARLDALTGQPLWGLDIAADMAMFSFGGRVERRDRRGVEEVGELALHVQCGWTMARGSDVVLTKADMVSESPHPSERSAELTARLVGLLEPSRAVEEIDLGPSGLLLRLSDGLALSVQEDIDGEQWRFFTPGVDAAHLVRMSGSFVEE